MNDRPLALIGARLQRPAMPPAEWPRPRLQARLDGILDHRLTRLVAPAGFGKSLALAAWAARTDEAQAQVSWLRLESGECEPALLCAYLEAALRAPLQGRRRPGKALLGRSGGLEAHAWLGRLLTLLGDGGTAGPARVLVLDDAHWLAVEPAALEVLRRLLREAPANFHLVMAARRSPCAVPGELQATGQVLELGSAELALAADERAGMAAAVLHAPCPSATLAWCAQLCGGWPLAWVLALRQLRPPFDAAGASARQPALLADLEAFLDDQVLRGLPARLLEFLLLVSVAPCFDAGLAEALTGAEDAAELINQAAQQGLLTVEPQGGWRIEPALAACLRVRLQRERPGHAAVMHRRAGGWHAERGEWQAAVEHALAAGDSGRAADWLEQGGETLLGIGRFGQLLDWIDALPAQVCLARPRLGLLQAWALSFLHRRDEAAALLARLARQRREGERESLAIEAVLSALADDGGRARQLGEQVLRLEPEPGSLADHAAHTALIFGLTADACFDQVEALRERQSPAAAFDADVLLYRQNLYGFSAFQAGRLDPAGLIFEEVMARAQTAGEAAARSAAVAAAYLAAIHYERDDAEQARSLLQGRREPLVEGVFLGALLNCLRTEARLADLAGQLERALALLDEGTLLGRRRGQRRLQAGCLGEAVRLQLAQGRTLDADRSLRQLQALAARTQQARGGIAQEATDEIRLAEARTLLAGNAPRRAVPLLRSLWQDHLAGGRAYQAARAAVVLVRALEAAGDPEGALDPLWQALRYGQQNGLVRSFADEGPALAGPIARLLLEGALPPDVDAEYLRRLRLALDPIYRRSAAAAASGASPAPPPGGSQPHLSTRETEILQYMARGLSNKEIARALGISPETVKWYLKHIYDKLQVSGRVQAIQAGLGIRVSVGEPDGEQP